MKQFVDEIEDRASIGNAQTHECTFAAFVQDEAEVVHHIENRLVVRLSRIGAGNAESTVVLFLLFVRHIIFLILVGRSVFDQRYEFLVVEHNSLD